MKLTKRVPILVVTGIYVVAIASLAVIHFGQIQQHQKLDRQLQQAGSDLANLDVARLISEKSALENQLNETTSQLEVVQGMLSNPIGSSIVTKILFDTAEDHNLEVIEMYSSVPSNEIYQNVDFSLILLTAHVEGDASNIVDFVIDLNNRLSTSIIKTVNITIPEDSAVDEATADVNMTIYTYEEGL